MDEFNKIENRVALFENSYKNKLNDADIISYKG